MAVPVRELLQADLKTAMKARDPTRISVLRAALAAVANAEAVPTPNQDSGPWRPGVSEVDRKVLTEDDVRAVLASEVAELDMTADELREHGRKDDADELTARAAMLRAYLDA